MQPTHAAIRGNDVAQDPRSAQGGAYGPVQVVGTDPVAVAEAEFVLAAFADLKGMRDAELKVTVSVDPQSGQPEIIYTGIQKKRSIEVLRKVYRARREARG
jgi:hypothetical protein